MSLHRKYRPGAGGIHQPCYFGATDPATLYLVEAGHVWIDDATDPTLVTMKKRNDANTAWTTVMTSAAVGVRGPSVAVDGNVPQFDGTTGAKLKDGGLSIDTDVALAANSNSRLVPQATIKSYIATLLQGLKPKDAVLCATTANITLSGEQTIDGVVTSASRVLVKNQTTPKDNGIYVTAAGAWTRATDNDAWTEIVGGFVFVEEGTTLADTGWMCTSDPGGTLGTTAVNWTQYSGVGAYQPLASILNSITSLASTLGLLEQTSAGVVGIRLLGVAAGTSVPTRADADARYAAASHTHAAADIASGLLALARGGINLDMTATGPGFLVQASAGATPTVRAIALADLPALTGSLIFPEVAPASPSAYDEEGTSGSLAGIWTSTTDPDASFTKVYNRDGTYLGMYGPGKTSSRIWTLRQPITSGDGNYPTAFTCTAKFSISGGSANMALLVQLSDNAALSSGNYLHIGLTSGGQMLNAVVGYNNNGSATNFSGSFPNRVYVHYQRNTGSSNNVKIYVSLDGRAWVRFATITKTTNIAYMHVYFQGGLDSDASALWIDWIRVNDGRFLQPE
jgi:hypothetical protein